MRNYYESIGEDPFDYLPVTFHVKTGVNDLQFQRFKAYYQAQNKKAKKDNIWIIKPGEGTNRGDGIEVADNYYDIERLLKEATVDQQHTCIIQKYIQNPLLIN